MVPSESDEPAAPGAEAAEPRGFAPETPLRASLRLPGSKSIAQRVLACAAFARGTTRVAGLPQAADVLAGLQCARAAGARFPSGGKLDDLMATALLARGARGAIHGAPPGPAESARPWTTFPVGESGTSARLFAALGALGRPVGSGCELQPVGTLRRRSSPALFDALRRAGAGVQFDHDAEANSFAVALTAAAPPAQLELHHPVSSQEVSALLLALATAAEPRELFVIGDVPSRPYVELTRATLAEFGVVVTESALSGDGHGHGGTRYVVTGPLRAPDAQLEVEPDGSSAGVALVAGAIRGQRLEVLGLGARSRQPDALALPRALEAAGVPTEFTDAGGLAVQPGTLRSFTFDCTASPDFAPPLVALAAAVVRGGGEPCSLTGLETLPGKESSRIDVLARGLEALGYGAEATASSLTVSRGPGRRPDSVVLDPDGDHRMAFAFALLSLFEPGVRVSNPGCVAKSWPSFWTDLPAPSDDPR